MTTNTEAGAVADVAGKPVRVQLRRTKGWRMPANTVSVARPGKFGNPFPSLGAGKLDTKVPTIRSPRAAWRPFASGSGRCGGTTGTATKAKRRGRHCSRACQTFAAKASLVGARPGSPCHADALLELANAPAHLSEQGATAS